MARARRGKSSAKSPTFATPVLDDSFLRNEAIQRELLRQQAYKPPAWFDDYVESTQLREIEDRREWHPDRGRGAVDLGGRFARIVVHRRPIVARSRRFSAWGVSDRGLPVGVQVPFGLRFESPFRVLTCMRRKIRRAVIFARKKAGKGARKRRRHRNWRSNVTC